MLFRVLFQIDYLAQYILAYCIVIFLIPSFAQALWQDSNLHYTKFWLRSNIFLTRFFLQKEIELVSILVIFLILEGALLIGRHPNHQNFPGR